MLGHGVGDAALADLVLRDARQSDAKDVAALVDRAYEPWIPRIGMSPGPMTADYDHVIGTRQVTVAELRGVIAGVLVASVAEEGFLIENVAVHPSRHGIGLGRALLEFAEASAKRQGFTSIYLYTHSKMEENVDLYTRIGYVEYDRRAAEGFALVFMRKQLG